MPFDEVSFGLNGISQNATWEKSLNKMSLGKMSFDKNVVASLSSTFGSLSGQILTQAPMRTNPTML